MLYAGCLPLLDQEHDHHGDDDDGAYEIGPLDALDDTSQHALALLPTIALPMPLLPGPTASMGLVPRCEVLAAVIGAGTVTGLPVLPWISSPGSMTALGHNASTGIPWRAWTVDIVARGRRRRRS